MEIREIDCGALEPNQIEEIDVLISKMFGHLDEKFRDRDVFYSPLNRPRDEFPLQQHVPQDWYCLVSNMESRSHVTISERSEKIIELVNFEINDSAICHCLIARIADRISKHDKKPFWMRKALVLNFDEKKKVYLQLVRTK